MIQTGWEQDFWAYLSLGDGINCPIVGSCEFRQQGGKCLHDRADYFNVINRFLDDESPVPVLPADFELKLPDCPKTTRIFETVEKLAVDFRAGAGLENRSFPTYLINRGFDNRPIEVRQLPLKAYHGAVWRMQDSWLVHINSQDTPARQRFTLYHEIFHIIAHCRGTPVFRKTANSPRGSFNELLADHFAAMVLLPIEQIPRVWHRVGDLKRTAAFFNVPPPVMYFGLKGMRLV